VMDASQRWRICWVHGFLHVGTTAHQPHVQAACRVSGDRMEDDEASGWADIHAVTMRASPSRHARRMD